MSREPFESPRGTLKDGVMDKLGDYLHDPVDGARLERQWDRVARGIAPAPFPFGRVFLALAAAAAIAGPAVWWARSSPSSTQPVAAAAPALRFADGSRADLSPGARIEIEQDAPAAVTVKLLAGRGDFVVTHDAARPFVVRAGPVEVRVVGTRFSVDRDREAQVRVSVQEGVVEVRSGRPGDLRRLAAGETLTVGGEEAAAPAVSTAPEASSAPAVMAAAAAPSAAATPAPSPPAADPQAAAEDARQIFERAAEARRRGDARGAAELYQQLLTRYPRDGRAGVAAFDLARLRMDSLGDLAGALPLLERAAQGGGSFREDALARLVRAYQSTGSVKGCQRARAAYLAGFPRGVHAAAVSASCP